LSQKPATFVADKPSGLTSSRLQKLLGQLSKLPLEKPKKLISFKTSFKRVHTVYTTWQLLARTPEESDSRRLFWLKDGKNSLNHYSKRLMIFPVLKAEIVYVCLALD
jgi:hypothetical protein